MPFNNDFSKQQEEFTKNLGTLNKTLTTSNTELKNQVSDHTKLIKHSGSINVKAMKDHTEAMRLAASNIKGNIVKNEIELKSDKLEKTIKGLADSTYKLDESSEKFQVSAKELSLSNKELSSSMGDVVDITNKNMERLKYLGDHMKKFGKWAAVGGAVGAGYLGYKALKKTGKVGVRAATAPARAGIGAIKSYGDLQENAATDVLGNVRTDMWGGYKKALGTGLAMSGGLVPGMFLESMTANLFGGDGGGGGAGGPGMGSRMAAGAGGLAKKGAGGIQYGVGKLAEFVAGFPKETREQGIFKMIPAEGGNFEVSPSEEFSADFGTVSNKIEETNNIISHPDERMQTKIMSKSFAAALDESGKSGLLRSMFTGVFRLGSTIAYMLPIFGAGYKAELPQVRRYGMFGAMLQTLGMIYVHSRFASEESNRLALQQAKLLQIGFEIPGTLWKPGPRSLSEWLGKSIGDTLSGETGPLTFMKEMVTGKLKGLFGIGKEKGSGLLGMIPGYKDWAETKGMKKEADELKASPALARKLLLLTDIRDILNNMNEIMLKRGGSAMAKPISLAKAASQPYEITKTGNAEVHKGEAVSKPKGGIFSRMLGGIGSLFTGGIFKKIKGWITGLFDPLTQKLDQLLNWFKATFSFLAPAVEAMHEIETAFGIGKGVKITELGRGGGAMRDKREKDSIFGGIFNSIRELPRIVEKSLTNIGENIKKIFNQELGEEKTGIGSIIMKSYQTLVPNIFKQAGGKIFESVKGVINSALTATYNLTKESGKLLTILYDSKVLNVIGAIPKSTWEAIKGLIPLGKDLFKSVGNLLNATTIIHKFSMSVQQASVIDIPNIIAEVRTNLIEKILPKSWASIFNTISDRILEWSQVSFKSFSGAFEAMEGAEKDFAQEKIKRPGIAGVVSGIFKYLFKILKEAFDPLGTALVNSIYDIVWFGIGVKGYSFSKLFEDFKSMGIKMKTAADDFTSSLTEFSQFTKAPAMAKGGLLYAAKGVVVGEAGPEAVLPLDDPKATAMISGMFSKALRNLDIGGSANFEHHVINRLDAIISILGGHPGSESKTSKIVSGSMGIFGKLLNGITEIGVTLFKLPFQIGSDIAQGIAKGLSKGVEMLTDVAHTMLSAIRTGFTALRHTIDVGVATIKTTLSTVWSAITAPFKVLGKIIMKPFQAIKDRFIKAKEKVKEKVKGVIRWLKPGGKKAPIGVDKEGGLIYAKWPALLVKYTKGIYNILLKEFGFGMGNMRDKMRMMRDMIPIMMPYILSAIGVAGIAMAAFDAFRGTKKAKEWHGVKEGEKATTSQKVTAGIGGLLGGTFKNLAARVAWGAAKGGAIGLGAGALGTLGFGAPIGAAIGALAGGILGAFGGKNIAKALQAIWNPIKKVAVAVYNFVTWPFKIIGKLIKKFTGWLKKKIPWLDVGSEALDNPEVKEGSFNKGSAWLDKKLGLGETKLAAGGIVTRPTKGLIGESGPEAVIPLNKVPALAKMVNDNAMTSSREIANHKASVELSKQKAGADRLIEGNKKLQEAMIARNPVNNNIVTSQINNSSSLTNTVTTNGIQQKFDDETERILGGRLS